MSAVYSIFSGVKFSHWSGRSTKGCKMTEVDISSFKMVGLGTVDRHTRNSGYDWGNKRFG